MILTVLLFLFFSVEEEAYEEVEEEAQKDETEIQVSCGLGQDGAFCWYMCLDCWWLCAA
jgi:hypothetical protein